MATNTALAFDPYAFAGRRAHPVHVAFIAGEPESTTGIAFEDYSRMRQIAGATPAFRHRPAPSWARNNSQLRELIVHFMERRAGYREPQAGTHVERLARAKAKLAAKVPRLTEVLTNLCHEYVQLKKQDPASLRIRTLEIEIENYDSQLILNKRAEAVIAGVVYRSYCVGENSVEVGKAVGIKPPHVRALLHRLHQTWNKMPERAVAAAASAQRKAERATKRKTKPTRAAARAKRHAKQYHQRDRVTAQRQATIDQAVELYKAGVLNQNCGVHPTVLYTALRRAGVPLKTEKKTGDRSRL